MQSGAKSKITGKGLGVMECVMEVQATSGVGGFFRGLTARVPRVFTGQAVTFAVYEKVASFLT